MIRIIIILLITSTLYGQVPECIEGGCLDIKGNAFLSFNFGDSPEVVQNKIDKLIELEKIEKKKDHYYYYFYITEHQTESLELIFEYADVLFNNEISKKLVNINLSTYITKSPQKAVDEVRAIYENKYTKFEYSEVSGAPSKHFKNIFDKRIEIYKRGYYLVINYRSISYYNELKRRKLIERNADI